MASSSAGFPSAVGSGIAVAAWVVTLLAAALPLPAIATPTGGACDTGTERPSVGLALGGGGARGGAHIGVLQELHALGVPIDCIAGTSMGAVVGGLYAAGHPPDDLERILAAMDWNRALRDRPPRAYWAPHRLRDDTGQLPRFPIGVREGQLTLPAGVVEGQELELALRRLAAPADGVRRFNALPTPFVAVAADLGSGEEVRLDSGDLSTAIRASMAFPGLLAPVFDGDRLLVDGGIAANVPVQALRAMGADRVIAVHLLAPPTDGEEMRTLLGGPRQITKLYTQTRTAEQLANLRAGDVYIAIPERGVGLTDFHRATEAIPAGRDAVRAVAEQLRPWALPFPDGAARRPGYRDVPLGVDTSAPLAALKVSSDDPRLERLLAARVRQEAGEPLDRDALETDLRRIYALEYFDRLRYEVTTAPGDRAPELTVEAEARRAGRQHFRAGAILEEDFDEGSSYTVFLQHQWMPINQRAGEWTNRLRLGDRSGLSSALHQPIEASGRWFVAPRAAARSFPVDRFEERRREARFRIREVEASAALGRTLGNAAEVRVGVLRRAGDARVRIGTDEEGVAEGFSEGAGFVEMNFDTLDDPDLPTSGRRAHAEWVRPAAALGGADRVETVRVELQQAASTGPHTFGLEGRFETTRDTEGATLQRLFDLGGFRNLSGYRRHELFGRHAGLVQALYAWRIGVLDAPIQLPVFLGATVEAGNVWQERDAVSSRDLERAGSIFAGTDTALGPLHLGYGRSQSGRSAAYFSLGRTF